MPRGHRCRQRNVIWRGGSPRTARGRRCERRCRWIAVTNSPRLGAPPLRSAPDQGDEHYGRLHCDQRVRRFRRQVKPEPRPGIVHLAVGGEPQPAREDLDDGGARGLVLRQLLARVEAEHRGIYGSCDASVGAVEGRVKG